MHSSWQYSQFSRSKEYDDVSSWKLPTQLLLADPYFHVLNNIDSSLELGVLCGELGYEVYRLGINLPSVKEIELFEFLQMYYAVNN